MRKLYPFVNGVKGGVYMTDSQAYDFYILGNHIMMPLDYAMSLISKNWTKCIEDGRYELIPL